MNYEKTTQWLSHGVAWLMFELKFTENWSATDKTAGLSSSTTKFPLIMQWLYTGYSSKDMPEVPYPSHKLLMLSLNCKSQWNERGENLANIFYKKPATSGSWAEVN